MIFFHYCVLSNYFWLFIEGLYLFTLLVETFFPEKRYFYWYIIIGWGKNLPTIQLASFLIHSPLNNNSLCWWFCATTGTPTLCVTIWAVLRLHFDDIGYVGDHLAAWYDDILLPGHWESLWTPGVGTWTTMLPSGGSSRDLFWPQLWYDVTHRDVCVCDGVISLFPYIYMTLLSLIQLLWVFSRSTLSSLLASSSYWSRSFSPQTSVEMNPVFTCESIYFLYLFVLKWNMWRAGYH